MIKLRTEELFQNGDQIVQVGVYANNPSDWSWSILRL